MSARIIDGKAIAAGFRPGLDPLNVLAVGLWTDALRGGKVATMADLPPAVEQKVFTKDDRTNRLLRVIGPEGGLDRSEAEALADAGAQLVSLGPQILRTENAAVVTTAAPASLPMLVQGNFNAVMMSCSLIMW